MCIGIALHSTPSQSYRVSLAMWNHTVLLGGVVVRALDSQWADPGFDSRPRPLSDNDLGQVANTTPAVHQAV